MPSAVVALVVAGSPPADPQGAGQPAERPLVAGQPVGDDPVRHPARHQVGLAVAAIP
jgi:hypothetical protein